MVTITESLFDYVCKREQRYAALRQKIDAHRVFLEHVEALIETHGVETTGDLPPKEQHDIAERDALLTPPSDLELEREELRQLDQVLKEQLPSHFFTIQ